MRNVICICLAEGNGHERYQKLIHCLKTEDVIFLQGKESVEELFSLQEKEKRAVIFLIYMDNTGINLELDAVLKKIVSVPKCLEGLSAGIITVGDGELYTKEAARKTAFVLNRAGCIIHGKAFTEVTGSMRNMKNQAAYRKVSLEEAFLECAKETIAEAAKVPEHTADRKIRRLTCIHSSIEVKSNTYAYWKLVREQLVRQKSDIEISEINLYGEEIRDCRGCSFQICQSLGEQRRCVFGGIMTEKIYPAIEQSDAVVLLCPNYNDAIGSNLCACINRLTALYRSMDFSGKYLYVIVVSGYSGGEIVAEQAIDAMVLNKGFTLPKYAVDIQMANLPGEILEEEGISDCAFSFAKRIV
ncbi:MAG: NAD(P)H-dependent oxidoreductase [Dorea sp.]|uniref:flavodoxin family protein n=1 Tax=Dorea sp. YH-dor226 TaxID=3151119 RepID=UPI0030544B5F|nr:NAD(P)H-dependent oxidoreductase [Dorea sp.]